MACSECRIRDEPTGQALVEYLRAQRRSERERADRYALELDRCVEAFASEQTAMARNGRHNVAAIVKDIISERDKLQEKYTRCYSELVNTARRASLAERDLIDAQRERDSWHADTKRLIGEHEKDHALLAQIRNEVDCRIVHGADSNGHLEAILKLMGGA